MIGKLHFRIVQSKIGHFYVEHRRWLFWHRVCSLEGWRTYVSFDEAFEAVIDLKFRNHDKIVAVYNV